MSKSFGEAVAAARKAREGLTQAALGAKVGVTGQQIARIENGKRGGSAKVLVALALEFGIDLNLLKPDKRPSNASSGDASFENAVTELA